MSWTNLPASAGTDWQAVSFVNQFIEAANERGAGLSLVVAGDDIQAASFWANLQNTVEILATDYIDTNSYPTVDDLRGQPVGGSNGIGDYGYTTASFRAAAGLNANGWTRKYPDGSGGVTTDYGPMQSGDYIGGPNGAHVFNELQSALKVLKWTWESRTGTAYESENFNAYEDGFGEDPDYDGSETFPEDCKVGSLSTAKSRAASDRTRTENSSSNDTGDFASSTRISLNEQNTLDCPDHPVYQAILTFNEFHLQYSLNPHTTSVQFIADVWAVPGAPAGTNMEFGPLNETWFSASASESTYQLLTSFPASTTISREIRYGDSDQSTLWPQGSLSDYGDQIERGYDMTPPSDIVYRWDHPTGFVYQ